MMIHNDTARDAVMAYMSSRCDVSSQHKLPTESELLATQMARFIGEGRMRLAIQQLLRAGKLIDYDGCLSDRKIDVL